MVSMGEIEKFLLDKAENFQCECGSTEFEKIGVNDRDRLVIICNSCKAQTVSRAKIGGQEPIAVTWKEVS